MNLDAVAKILGILGASLMPICNIPLILRIVKRNSSNDISLGWVFGVEICVLAMLPSSLLSEDPVLKLFGVVNSIFFSAVTLVVWMYHKK